MAISPRWKSTVTSDGRVGVDLVGEVVQRRAVAPGGRGLAVAARNLHATQRGGLHLLELLTTSRASTCGHGRDDRPPRRRTLVLPRPAPPGDAATAARTTGEAAAATRSATGRPAAATGTTGEAAAPQPPAPPGPPRPPGPAGRSPGRPNAALGLDAPSSCPVGTASLAAGPPPATTVRPGPWPTRRHRYLGGGSGHGRQEPRHALRGRERVVARTRRTRTAGALALAGHALGTARTGCCPDREQARPDAGRADRRSGCGGGRSLRGGRGRTRGSRPGRSRGRGAAAAGAGAAGAAGAVATGAGPGPRSPVRRVPDFRFAFGAGAGRAGALGAGAGRRRFRHPRGRCHEACARPAARSSRTPSGRTHRARSAWS